MSLHYSNLLSLAWGMKTAALDDSGKAVPYSAQKDKTWRSNISPSLFARASAAGQGAEEGRMAVQRRLQSYTPAPASASTNRRRAKQLAKSNFGAVRGENSAIVQRLAKTLLGRSGTKAPAPVVSPKAKGGLNPPASSASGPKTPTSQLPRSTPPPSPTSAPPPSPSPAPSGGTPPPSLGPDVAANVLMSRKMRKYREKYPAPPEPPGIGEKLRSWAGTRGGASTLGAGLGALGAGLATGGLGALPLGAGAAAGLFLGGAAQKHLAGTPDAPAAAAGTPAAEAAPAKPSILGRAAGKLLTHAGKTFMTPSNMFTAMGTAAGGLAGAGLGILGGPIGMGVGGLMGAAKGYQAARPATTGEQIAKGIQQVTPHLSNLGNEYLRFLANRQAIQGGFRHPSF